MSQLLLGAPTRPRDPRELAAWPGMRRRSVFSADGRYRYRLERRWGSGPVALWCCCNPSKAGARRDPVDENSEIDDPSALRMMQFSWAWGFGGMLVGNLFGLVATDPCDLLQYNGRAWTLRPDAVGAENDVHLAAMATGAGLCVAGWGACSFVPAQQREAFHQRVGVVQRLLRERGELRCLGLTADGCPIHPLARGTHRVPNGAPHQPYRRAIGET